MEKNLNKNKLNSTIADNHMITENTKSTHISKVPSKSFLASDKLKIEAPIEEQVVIHANKGKFI
jgi:hypothetical protein